MSETLEIVVVRHGESKANAEARMQGRFDSPLNDRGRAQAHVVGRWFASQGILWDVAFCSPLLRASETAQIIKLALKNAKLELTDASLKADRTAIRDALANVKNYSGLASGPINFCADATPQCRDGNRTGILVEYTKGGKDFDMRVLARVGFEADFGL